MNASFLSWGNSISNETLPICIARTSHNTKILKNIFYLWKFIADFVQSWKLMQVTLKDISLIKWS